MVILIVLQSILKKKEDSEWKLANFAAKTKN